jgi:hypothetical protein
MSESPKLSIRYGKKAVNKPISESPDVSQYPHPSWKQKKRVNNVHVPTFSILEVDMSRKGRVLDRSHLRNNILEKNLGDKPYKESNLLTDFYKEGFLIFLYIQ